MNHVLFSQTYNLQNKPDKQHSDFGYDGCVYLSSVNPSRTYQFNIKNLRNIYPRHCLELCNTYQQNYALLNGNKCLCTNRIPKIESSNKLFSVSSTDLICTQECPGNYFYTCGSTTNSSVYSVYSMKLHCPNGKRLKIDNS